MLSDYKKKRNFTKTPEPAADQKNGSVVNRFVVQRHNASHLHYDFRLQLNGVLKSWAVPKGPSMNADDKRLAVQVEDHPVSYYNFSGTIPAGNYGAGTVAIWDKGSYTPVDEKGKPLTARQAAAWLKKGELKFSLKGKRLNGEFVLVQLKKDPKNWLLIKHKDGFAVNKPFNPDKNNVSSKRKEKILTTPVAKKATVKFSTEKKLSSYYKPMLATPAKKAFDDKNWIFEIKWDGYRAIAECGDKALKFYSRNGLSFINKYPSIATALEALPHNMVIDGEIVVLDKAGKPSFQLLQQYDKHPEYPIMYYVFDLLFLEGKSTRDIPLTERKALLKKALPAGSKSIIQFCDHVPAEGVRFFKKAVAMDLEGIIAKKADSLYYCGIRNTDWLKIKHHNTREAVIAGFTQPAGSRKHFGALVLAEQKRDQLTYIGHTGTGFTEKILKELWTQMQPYITTASPFKEKIKVNMPVTWLKPVLVCQVKFAEQTADGMLRHPVYMGLRADKEAAEVKESNETAPQKKLTRNKTTMATEKEKTIKVNNHPLQFTNLTKIYWPKDKITKGDLLNYYEKMAPVILPYLKNRPLSLKRNPNGIADKGFYQKDAGENFPAWIKTAPFLSESTGKTVDYTICNDKATLLYLANLGCIEMNPWNSTVKSPDKPSYLIIDIDPAAKNNFDQVIETAQVTGQVLEKAGATFYCKTSGATGLHIYVPLQAKYTYEQARSFGQIIATLVQEQLPAFTSLERSLSKRGNKIYVDYLQNSRGQTIASAYSVRPVNGAQVSTPLRWKEVKKGLHPSQFTIFNTEKRVKELGDIFYMAIQKGVNIKTCLKNLGY
jgi:bifunctional non-homologous end joining protein LigD